MNGPRIDRLTLMVPKRSAADATRLARLVANGLAAARLPASRGRIGGLRVDVKSGGADPATLSRSIVAGVFKAIKRSV